MPNIRRAVILAAGMGTRFLPATKAIPKELLPVFDRPLIQYAVEEAVASGIHEIVIVDAEGKEALRAHFGHNADYSATLRQRDKDELADMLDEIENTATFEYTRQDEPRGVADAVLTARHLVEGQPFALIFPDDLIFGTRPCLGQLASAYSEGVSSILAVQRVLQSEIPQYGIVAVDSDDTVARITDVVEKPAIEDAPSDLGIVGRYILGPGIFDYLDRVGPSEGGEYHITDAFMEQITNGETVLAYRFTGTRYDVGRPVGLVAATVARALHVDEARDAVFAEVARFRQEQQR